MAADSRRWLVTGGAGFIGSHLVEELLRNGQVVTTLDNLSTGKKRNLEQVRQAVGDEAWSRHRFVEGDICDLVVCREACEGVEHVLHQAALGSVPRSIADPITSNGSNVSGFLNVLVAARDAGVSSLVYASSSSVYGDHPGLPKVEDVVGKPLSPYAVTKCVNELYARVFSLQYGLRTVGLRYFNVFGARQDPEGPYAAVIPRWVRSLLRRETVRIFGDGETSRDFCYVKNVVQANLRAATARDETLSGEVFNVAVGERTTLNGLFRHLRSLIGKRHPFVLDVEATYEAFRQGDVRHSLADISKARSMLGYEPSHDLVAGLEEALPWYLTEYHPEELAGLA